MSMTENGCPHCGNTNKHRESSAGTIQRCKWCKKEYEVSPTEYRFIKKRFEYFRIPPIVWLTMGGFMILCGGFGAWISNIENKQPLIQEEVREEIPLKEVNFPKKEQPIIVQYDPSKNKDPEPIVREKPSKIDLPKKEPLPELPKFIGDESKASELLTQAKFLRGTNQMDRCKIILNDILTNHTDTKAAIEARNILVSLK